MTSDQIQIHICQFPKSDFKKCLILYIKVDNNLEVEYKADVYVQKQNSFYVRHEAKQGQFFLKIKSHKNSQGTEHPSHNSHQNNTFCIT